MADNLTDDIENELLDALTGQAPVEVAAPLLLALVTTLGTDAQPGKEVSGGNYERQQVNFASSQSGTVTSTNLIKFSDMPNARVVGIEVFDSAGKRLMHGPLAKAADVAESDTLEFGPGAVSLTLK